MRKMIIILIISLLTLSACATNKPAEALELPQNYSVQITNGTISVDYPADWVVSSEFADLGLNLATSSDVASSAFDGTLDEGQVYINIAFAPESLLEQDTPSEVLQAIVASISEADGTVSEVESRTLNGKVAAFVTLDAEDSVDGIFVVIDSGDAYSTMVVAVPDGDIAQYQATVEAIAGSIEYLLEEIEVTPEMTVDAELTPEAETTEAVEATEEATEESE